MKPLDLTRVYRYAPYKVWTENGRDYNIETSRGQIFVIGFMDDYSIWQDGAYQFTITNQSHQPSPSDQKLRETILLLIEAFFAANPDILLYICETGDGKQAFRNRLFIRWFNTYEHRDLYYIQTAEGEMDGQMNFAAIISRLTCPQLPQAIEEFSETVSLLFDPV